MIRFNTYDEVEGQIYLDWCVPQDLFEALLADWVPFYNVLQENVQNLCLLACSMGQQVISNAQTKILSNGPRFGSKTLNGKCTSKFQDPDTVRFAAAAAAVLILLCHNALS